MGVYDQATAAVDAVKGKLPSELSSPQVAIICGTGLGGLAEVVENPVEIPYEQIPHFKQSTVQGHAGKLIVGYIGKVTVICMKGRLHSYEGFDIKDTVLPVRVFQLLGIKTVIATNAAGGLNPKFKVGDIMLLDDHINFPGLSGLHPLKGANDERFGDRFVALSDAYDLELRKQFMDIAESQLKLTRPIHEGTYVYVSGPTFESRAESRMLASLGADAVGMSTVPEVCVARHGNMRVLALSLITNVSNLEKTPSAREQDDSNQMLENKANHEEVLEAGAEAASDIQKIVQTLASQL